MGCLNCSNCSSSFSESPMQVSGNAIRDSYFPLLYTNSSILYTLFCTLHFTLLFGCLFIPAHRDLSPFFFTQQHSTPLYWFTITHLNDCAVVMLYFRKSMASASQSLLLGTFLTISSLYIFWSIEWLWYVLLAMVVGDLDILLSS